MHCNAHHGCQLGAEVVEEVKVELESEIVQEDGPPGGGDLDSGQVVC